jgi:hypothetical protein
MQNGSLIWAERSRHGPVWEYRWREPGRANLNSDHSLQDHTSQVDAVSDGGVNPR